MSQAASNTSRALHVVLEIVLVLGVKFTFSIINFVTKINIIGVIGMVVTLALAWFLIERRGQTWQDLGMARPAWLPTLGWTVLIVAVTMGLQFLLSDFARENADYSRFEPLRGNLGYLIWGLISVWVTAAFIEEMLYRGYLIDRLAALFAEHKYRWGYAVLISGILFGLVHFYQGPAGILMTGMFGLAFGWLFLLLRRNLWPLIFAHGIINSISFIAIYLGAF